MTHDHGVARKIAWHGNSPPNPELTRGHSWKPLNCWKCCKNIGTSDPTRAPLHRPSLTAPVTGTCNHRVARL